MAGKRKLYAAVRIGTASRRTPRRNGKVNKQHASELFTMQIYERYTMTMDKKKGVKKIKDWKVKKVRDNGR